MGRVVGLAETDHGLLNDSTWTGKSAERYTT